MLGRKGLLSHGNSSAFEESSEHSLRKQYLSVLSFYLRKHRNITLSIVLFYIISQSLTKKKHFLFLGAKELIDKQLLGDVNNEELTSLDESCLQGAALVSSMKVYLSFVTF